MDILSDQIVENQIKIIPPKDYKIPTSYNLDIPNISEANKQYLSIVFEDFESFLRFPVVIDKFKNHGERRKWRFETLSRIKDPLQAELFNAQLQQNKMKGNKLAIILYHLDVLYEEEILPSRLVDPLISVLQPILPRAETNKRARTRLGSPWGRLAISKKIAVVDEISERLVEILNYFAK